MVIPSPASSEGHLADDKFGQQLSLEKGKDMEKIQLLGAGEKEAITQGSCGLSL